MREQRVDISAKETELLLVFRELMEFNYFVPDHYFDREQAASIKKSREATSLYLVPLKTFWRELVFDEYYEPNLRHPDYQKQVYPMQDIESTIGQYLPKPLREAILAQKDKIERLREGGTESALHYREPELKNENLVFQKFSSQAEMRQTQVIAEEKRVIDLKRSKKDFTPDVPFEFTPGQGRDTTPQ